MAMSRVRYFVGIIVSVLLSLYIFSHFIVHGTPKNNVGESDGRLSLERELYNKTDVIVKLTRQLQSGEKHMSVRKEDDLTFGGHSSDFTKVNRGMYIYSAYLDLRTAKPKVRIIALASKYKKHLKIQCNFDKRLSGSQLWSTGASMVMKDTYLSPFCEFTVAIITCHMDQNVTTLPQHVSLNIANQSVVLHRMQIKHHASRPPTSTLGLCSKTLYNMPSESFAILVEYMELQKLLGVSHVYIYGCYNCSPLIHAVLKHYSDNGFLTLLPWHIPHGISFNECYSDSNEEIPSCVKCFAQRTSINDCLYRNINNHKYLANIDLDEIIVPYKHANIVDMLEELRSSQEQLVASYIFPEVKYWIRDGPKILGTQKNNFLRLDQLSSGKKSIIDTDLTIWMEVHLIKDKPLNASIKWSLKVIDSGLGAVLHYKNHKSDKDKVIKDYTMFKYQSSIAQKVISVFQIMLSDVQKIR